MIVKTINGKHNTFSMSISEPFVLATYASTLRGAVRDRTLVGAYTSVHRISNKLDEYVTVAAQADSVHILDVSLGCED